MELAPLTILFGANGAGKSTILDAIEDALILPANRDRKIVESLRRPKFRSAVVYATLDDWQTPGSSDERIMRHVLWMSSNDFEDIVQSDLEDSVDYCPSIKDLLFQRATKMIESGTIGTPEERTQIANHLLEHSVLAFGGLQGDSETNWGLVCRAPLDDLAIPENAFNYVGVYDFDGDLLSDELLTAIYDLADGRDAIVTELKGDPESEPSHGGNTPVAARKIVSNGIRPLPMRLVSDSTSSGTDVSGHRGHFLREVSRWWFDRWWWTLSS